MKNIYVRPDKVILTDCDGVLLDWEYAFDVWMHRHGYKIKVTDDYQISVRYNLDQKEADKLILMFNESAWIRRLPPLRDAVKYVKKLHDDFGYVFHAITSLSDDEYSQHLRTKNLRELFGETVFERYVYLDCGAPKDEVLKEYKDSGCFWFEDKYHNAVVGVQNGLNSMLMTHEHNINIPTDIPKVKNWKEIYERITNEYKS